MMEVFFLTVCLGNKKKALEDVCPCEKGFKTRSETKCLSSPGSVLSPFMQVIEANYYNPFDSFS